jgi:hypothetical protein
MTAKGNVRALEPTGPPVTLVIVLEDIHWVERPSLLAPPTRGQDSDR